MSRFFFSKIEFNLSIYCESKATFASISAELFLEAPPSY